MTKLNKEIYGGTTPFGTTRGRPRQFIHISGPIRMDPMSVSTETNKETNGVIKTEPY